MAELAATDRLSTNDQGRITVPARIWKVLVILPEGDDDVKRISTDTRIIAVDTPNNNTLSPDWGTFRVSVDAIEQAPPPIFRWVSCGSS